jgi:hypothetical protein
LWGGTGAVDAVRKALEEAAYLEPTEDEWDQPHAPKVVQLDGVLNLLDKYFGKQKEVQK